MASGRVPVGKYRAQMYILPPLYRSYTGNKQKIKKQKEKKTKKKKNEKKKKNNIMRPYQDRIGSV